MLSTPTVPLQRGNTLPRNDFPGYSTKQSNGDAPALEIWGMWSIPSLPLLPGPLSVQKKKKKRAQTRLRMLSTKCVYKSHIYLIYMCRENLALNNVQWLICHKTGLKQNQSSFNFSKWQFADLRG